MAVVEFGITYEGTDGLPRGPCVVCGVETAWRNPDTGAFQHLACDETKAGGRFSVAQPVQRYTVDGDGATKRCTHGAPEPFCQWCQMGA